MRYEVCDVPGDGNCLFHAIGRSLGVPNKDLRELVISYLRVPNQTINGDKLSLWITNLDEYVSEMSRNAVWGSGIESSVVAHMFNRRILVYTRDRKGGAILMAEFPPEKRYFKDLAILYTGNHYLQLVETPP
jgi:hypothetical protein